MKELSEQDYRVIQEATNGIVRKYRLKDAALSQANPFLFALFVPMSNGESRVTEACNELFHGLGVLPKDKMLQIGECKDYCSLAVDEEGFDCIAQFNHPSAMAFKKVDEEYQFALKGIAEADAAAAEAEESEMSRLVEGIKAGRFKSKSSDGYLVLAGEFYDAIEAGAKKVEYRDFTEYNLKRTIGIKAIRFNRGYAKGAKQMRWKVKNVTLMDGEDNECDPFNMPDGFWPTAIAIHLGKRID
jgi:hypothetical protein